jgi:hypothetical protein
MSQRSRFGVDLYYDRAAIARGMRQGRGWLHNA